MCAKIGGMTEQKKERKPLNPPSRRTRAEWRELYESDLVSINSRIPRALRDEMKKAAQEEGRKIQDVYADAFALWLKEREQA